MTLVRRFPLVIVGALIGVAIAAADLAGGQAPYRAAISFAIVLGYAAAVSILATRSETMSVLAGRPVDERWEHINLEATALALGVSGIVALAAFLAAELTGRDPAAFAFMAAVIGLSYIGSVVFLRLRS